MADEESVVYAVRQSSRGANRMEAEQQRQERLYGQQWRTHGKMR